MKLIQENVVFTVTDVRFNAATERVIINFQPDHPLYNQPMPVSFHYRHDYPDYRYYRIFMNNNDLSSQDVNYLKDRKFIGNLVRFTRKDHTEWDGIQSSSLIIQPIQTQQQITDTMPKINKNIKNLTQMAIEVLSTTGPLHTNSIWNEIAKRGYVSNGKTPQATLAARLYMDIKENGEGSTFIKTGPGIFALRNKTAAPAEVPFISSALIDVSKLELPTPVQPKWHSKSIFNSFIDKVKNKILDRVFPI